MDPQLKKGILNIFILQVLKDKDMYGYDISKLVKNYFPETDESTIYAILRRLNSDGFTEMYYSEFSNGPKRKYYKLSDTGKEMLSEYIVSWKRISDILEDIGISQDLKNAANMFDLHICGICVFITL